MRPKSATEALWGRVVALATRQHGVISAAQLIAVGVSRRSISHWVAAGRLHRVHRGVYAVGHRGLSNGGRWMAAVLAAGDGAALSHRSAAELWALLKPRSGPPHLTIPGDGGRLKRPGLIIHRSRTLSRAEVTLRSAIPVTKPARTISDLRRTATPGEVRRAIRQAEFDGLPLDEGVGDGTRSDVEADFLRLCRRNALPMPEVNKKIGPYTVDFVWPQYGLAVETDAWKSHRGQQAFLDDRARDAFLRTRGFEVLRFSNEQIRGDEQTVVAVLRRYLAGAAKGTMWG